MPADQEDRDRGTLFSGCGLLSLSWTPFSGRTVLFHMDNFIRHLNHLAPPALRFVRVANTIIGVTGRTSDTDMFHALDSLWCIPPLPSAHSYPHPATAPSPQSPRPHTLQASSTMAHPRDSEQAQGH
ncbi:hypothetical protein PM082_016836 [Marasmius tenuissimus]|nr:hypothetical protein PM082_016836 [Marasmius tenuissimus]